MKKLITYSLLFTIIFSCKNIEERLNCKQHPDEWDTKSIKGNDIMDRNGFAKIKIHKSDSNSLNDIKFIEKLYDGTTRTFYPHEIKERKSK